MRKTLLFLALLAVSEAPALACSCMAPDGVERSRPLAREIVGKAAAIVEVDVTAGYDGARRLGEAVRVTRSLWGRAPAAFRLHRAEMPSSAACDIELRKGERRVLIVYAAPVRGRLRPHGLCIDHMARDRRYLQVLLQEARRRRT